MTDFEFDRTSSPGTNRTAPAKDSCACKGDRFVQVDDPDHEVYMRCPTCNAPDRPPVETQAWWKE